MGDSENEDLDALVFPMAAEMLYEILCPREQVARLDIAIAFAGDCNFGFVVGIEAFDVDTELSLSGRSLERPARYLRTVALYYSCPSSQTASAI